jgi:hypothetical protein
MTEFEIIEIHHTWMAIWLDDARVQSPHEVRREPMPRTWRPHPDFLYRPLASIRMP